MTEFYINIKRDLSLYNRFYESIKLLATQTGSLNQRLYKCYWTYLFPFSANNFKEKHIKEMYKYISEIMNNPDKCTNYKNFDGGNLHCHWKESKKIAECIFNIYDCIIEARCEK